MNEKKYMKPLWLAFPYIERGSIGWRMGFGEGYVDQFSAWFGTLTNEERDTYIKLFPEPIEWEGYWQADKKEDYENINCIEEEIEAEKKLYFANENIYIPYWREKGKPKYDIPLAQQMYEEKKNMVTFWGHTPNGKEDIGKWCFSQWWKGEFRINELDYICMEQYMMSQKAVLFGDYKTEEEIMKATDPKIIKALGRKVANFNQQVWDEVKYTIVLTGNWYKFSQNKELRDYLLSTKDAILAEASPYDKIWGIGMSEKEEGVNVPNKWKGSNLLGFALMEIRDELYRIWKNEDLCREVEV